MSEQNENKTSSTSSFNEWEVDEIIGLTSKEEAKNSNSLENVLERGKAQAAFIKTTEEEDTARWQAKQKLQHAEDVHTWRRDYALKVYRIICFWLFADFFLVMLYGIGSAYKFFLPDKTVIIAFISTATITVLGLFAIVMRWLFPGGQEEKGSISKDKGPAPDEE